MGIALNLGMNWCSLWVVRMEAGARNGVFPVQFLTECGINSVDILKGEFT